MVLGAGESTGDVGRRVEPQARLAKLIILARDEDSFSCHSTYSVAVEKKKTNPQLTYRYTLITRRKKEYELINP